MVLCLECPQLSKLPRTVLTPGGTQHTVLEIKLNRIELNEPHLPITVNCACFSWDPEGGTKGRFFHLNVTPDSRWPCGSSTLWLVRTGVGLLLLRELRRTLRPWFRIYWPVQYTLCENESEHVRGVYWHRSFVRIGPVQLKFVYRPQGPICKLGWVLYQTLYHKRLPFVGVPKR